MQLQFVQPQVCELRQLREAQPVLMRFHVGAEQTRQSRRTLQRVLQRGGAAEVEPGELKADESGEAWKPRLRADELELRWVVHDGWPYDLQNAQAPAEPQTCRHLRRRGGLHVEPEVLQGSALGSDAAKAARSLAVLAAVTLGGKKSSMRIRRKDSAARSISRAIKPGGALIGNASLAPPMLRHAAVAAAYVVASNRRHTWAHCRHPAHDPLQRLC